eukprot:jgi/Pico_ML_1/56061/g1656.t2
MAYVDVDLLIAVVGGLGKVVEEEEDEGKIYQADQDCVNCLKDLQRFLRRDDPYTRDAFHMLCTWNVPKNHILPILKGYHDQFEYAYNALKIMVFLTMPLDAESEEKNKQAEHLRNLKQAMVEEDVIAIVTSMLHEPLSKHPKMKENDAMIVQLVLAFFRNLLCIADSERSTDYMNRNEEIMLERLFQENVMELVLVITQHCTQKPFSNDTRILLEIHHRVFGKIKPYELVVSALKVEDDEGTALAWRGFQEEDFERFYALARFFTGYLRAKLDLKMDQRDRRREAGEEVDESTLEEEEDSPFAPISVTMTKSMFGKVINLWRDMQDIPVSHEEKNWSLQSSAQGLVVQMLHALQQAYLHGTKADQKAADALQRALLFDDMKESGLLPLLSRSVKQFDHAHQTSREAADLIDGVHIALLTLDSLVERESGKLLVLRRKRRQRKKAVPDKDETATQGATEDANKAPAPQQPPVEPQSPPVSAGRRMVSEAIEDESEDEPETMEVELNINKRFKQEFEDEGDPEELTSAAERNAVLQKKAEVSASQLLFVEVMFWKHARDASDIQQRYGWVQDLEMDRRMRGTEVGGDLAYAGDALGEDEMNEIVEGIDEEVPGATAEYGKQKKGSGKSGSEEQVAQGEQLEEGGTSSKRGDEARKEDQKDHATAPTFDEKLRTKALEILESANLDVMTVKLLRQTLESHFQIELLNKKDLIKDIVTQYIQAKAKELKH